jgi:exodeoxyribonuclease VII small subunit
MSAAASSSAPSAAPPAFEQTLAQLEILVARLESGDLPLDEALHTFEQGVRLTRECQAALGAAQQKVQLLLQRGETAALEEFDTANLERSAGPSSAAAIASGSVLVGSVAVGSLPAAPPDAADGSLELTPSDPDL